MPQQELLYDSNTALERSRFAGSSPERIYTVAKNRTSFLNLVRQISCRYLEDTREARWLEKYGERFDASAHHDVTSPICLVGDNCGRVSAATRSVVEPHLISITKLEIQNLLYARARH